MAGKPIATVTSMHTCPMVTGTVPHVGGPIVGPGSSNVLVNGKPVALMGDTCVCAGPPDTIVQGEPSVLINGKPVATVGCLTAHGGSITLGEPTVIIGSKMSNRKVTLREIEIPFPKVKKLDLVTNKVKDVVTGSKNGSSLKEAKSIQAKIKEEARVNALLPSYVFSI
ncbi:MAG: PAAR domain-containing protein [Prolixibacteraceae bacterium]|jgi:uncharacterized Zn-binding protein involved in type VI secretion|nr:PAAR domain-containing protein [Prolixibacteraceae bacterium]